MGFKSKARSQRAQLSPPAAEDVAGEGGSRASPAPRSTKMRTTRCYKNSLDRAGSGDDPTSASRREHRDAALAEAQHWGLGLVQVPPGLGFGVPSLGVSPLEGHPPDGAGDGAGTAVMEWAAPLAWVASSRATLSIQSVSLKHYRLSPCKLFIVAFGCE